MKFLEKNYDERKCAHVYVTDRYCTWQDEPVSTRLKKMDDSCGILSYYFEKLSFNPLINKLKILK